jgi:hypothetical protein
MVFPACRKKSSDLNVCSVFIPSGNNIPYDLFRTKISAYDTFSSPVWVTNELSGGGGGAALLTMIVYESSESL